MKYLVLLIIPILLFAQEKTPEVARNENKEIHGKLVELKNLKPEEFDKKIDDYRNSIEKYIEKKR